MNYNIGLVFDGGGGKGAYQIGVWRALKETGLDKYVTEVAGTSVGGLNAALFVKGNYEEAEHIWAEEIAEIKVLELQSYVSKLIDKHLGDMRFFDNTDINCYISAYNTSTTTDYKIYQYAGDNEIKIAQNGKMEYYNMKYLSEEKRESFVRENTIRKSVLLATSALPIICSAIKLKLTGKDKKEKNLQDGGLGDNSPVYPLFAAGKCGTVIVVHLDREWCAVDRSNFEDIHILELIPSQDLGGFFSGTINFDKNHAAKLMEYGYYDAIKLFERMCNNRLMEQVESDIRKSSAISYDQFQQYKLKLKIKQLTPDEKYALFNECEFLLSNNYSSLDYLSEKGIGKTLLRLLFGGGRKAKKKIMENTQELLDKIEDISACLNGEMLDMKLRIKYHTHVLISQHMYFLRLLELLEDHDKHLAHIDNFLTEKYPDYPQWDKTRTEYKIEELRADINRGIAELNQQDSDDYDMYKAEEKRIEEAESTRILRITPFKATVVTNKGTEVSNEPIKYANTFGLTVPPETVKEWLSKKRCSVAVIPEYMYKFHGGADKGAKPKGVTLITSADYFMYLWFLNTPKKERIGRCVCMLDMYSSTLYAYGYEVSADGMTYQKIGFNGKNHILSGNSNKYVREWLEKLFEGRYNDTLFFRTFIGTTDNELKKRLGDNNVFKNKIRPVNPYRWEKILVDNDGEELVTFVHNHIRNIYINVNKIVL